MNLRFYKNIFQKLKYIILEGGKFKFYKGNKNIIEFGTLSFNNYLDLLKNSLCVIIPGSKCYWYKN